MAWATVFDVDDSFTMVAVNASDADATYTLETCRLGDPRKSSARESRAERLLHFRKTVQDVKELVPALTAKAKNASNEEDREILVRTAERLIAANEAARREVLRYAAIPADAPATCACDRDTARTLPEWISRQLEDG